MKHCSLAAKTFTFAKEHCLSTLRYRKRKSATFQSFIIYRKVWTNMHSSVSFLHKASWSCNNVIIFFLRATLLQLNVVFPCFMNFIDNSSIDLLLSNLYHIKNPPLFINADLPVKQKKKNWNIIEIHFRMKCKKKPMNNSICFYKVMLEKQGHRNICMNWLSWNMIVLRTVNS